MDVTVSNVQSRMRFIRISISKENVGRISVSLTSSVDWYSSNCHFRGSLDFFENYRKSVTLGKVRYLRQSRMEKCIRRTRFHFGLVQNPSRWIWDWDCPCWESLVFFTIAGCLLDLFLPKLLSFILFALFFLDSAHSFRKIWVMAGQFSSLRHKNMIISLRSSFEEPPREMSKPWSLRPGMIVILCCFYTKKEKGNKQVR